MARLSDEEIEQRLAGLRGWRREGEPIRREFELARRIERVEGSPGG
jgi:hypothetical protein